MSTRQRPACCGSYMSRTSPSFAVRGRIAETLLDLGDAYQATALALDAARRPPGQLQAEIRGFWLSGGSGPDGVRTPPPSTC
ncbi:hypothetical protein ACRAWD_17580 [Caulobacter segnis]